MMHKLVDLILPPRCGSCQKIVQQNDTLCADCFQQAYFITAPFCKSCGLPFDQPVTGDQLCLACSQKKPLFDQARFVMPYDAFSKQMILSFKHGDRCDLAPLFAKWMHTSAPEMIVKCDVIVPVPLHWRRLLKRKFNQAAILGQALSRKTEIPCQTSTIKRIKNTAPQGHLSPGQRQKNLQGAFHCETDLDGKSILLVDDVYTTGTTIEGCCRVLKKAKARSVYVLTLARVLKSHR